MWSESTVLCLHVTHPSDRLQFLSLIYRQLLPFSAYEAIFLLFKHLLYRLLFYLRVSPAAPINTYTSLPYPLLWICIPCAKRTASSQSYLGGWGGGKDMSDSYKIMCIRVISVGFLRVPKAHSQETGTGAMLGSAPAEVKHQWSIFFLKDDTSAGYREAYKPTGLWNTAACNSPLHYL